MKMYVSNLSFKTGDIELYQLFASYGRVNSANVLSHNESGRSRGSGLVEMPDDDCARLAMQAINDKEMDGRLINVSEARARPYNLHR